MNNLSTVSPITHVKEELSIYDKLKILTDAAKYDVACTSSGSDRQGDGTGIGNTLSCGLCHSFAADGRCISLLKVLFSNECIYDCKYCINRRSNDVRRTSFTPLELCELTIQFYRRNLIEGLFLSSGIINSPDYTMELMYTAINMLRTKYRFQGYIHVKAIPGASQSIIDRLGLIVDRMSINLEFPTGDGLKALCPNKTRETILKPMRMIQNGITTSRNEVALFKNAPSFVPAGQSTQMIIGATNETDYQIVNVAAKLYENFNLKRVFYSGFVNVNNDPSLPGAVDDINFSATDTELVFHKMPHPEKVVLHKGYFPDTFSFSEDTTFAFVSLDVDLYAPTKAALELFWPRMSQGGCIMVHDYNSTQYTGAKKAVREFCDNTRTYPLPICDLHGSVVLVKQ